MNEKRVFISYGHDKYSHLIERFATFFSTVFKEVFFDGLSLKVGQKYDYEIEEAINNCDVVIFFMTEYSVRLNNNGLTNAEDSFCRDEIEYARSCKKSIIPVMLEECIPPLIVHRLQYINGKKILSNGNTINEEEYTKIRDYILYAIDDINKLAQYGESYSLMQVLNQFDNDIYSKGFVKNFTGRKWLANKCLSWIKDNSERVLCLLGEIGSGKSSFVTNLVFDDEEGFFVGVHYCRFDFESSIKVRNIIKSLTYSVATQLDGFSRFIEGISEKILDTASGTELFEKLLVEPLNRINNPGCKTRVVIIDAIDEIADPLERAEFYDILSNSSRLLPSWFKIIITSRPDNKLEYLLQDMTIIRIDTSSEENIQDIKDYIDKYSIESNLKISDENKCALINGSNGNFLYIFFALSDLLDNRSYNYNEQYPKGLDGIYARTVNRKFKDLDEYDNKIVPVFEVLCAAKAPISIAELSNIIGINKRQLLSTVQTASLFLRKENDTLCFYHKSFAEWLINSEKSAEYYIEEKSGNNKIISWIENIDNDFLQSNYCMSYGINHLVENHEYEFLNRLLQDKQFVVAEKYSTVLLEYLYRKKLDIVIRVIKSICVQPSVVSFVVIRRVVDGAINAGKFDDALLINEIQCEIESYNVFYYSGLGNIYLYSKKDIQSAKNAYKKAMTIAEKLNSDFHTKWNKFALSVCDGRMGKIMIESLHMEEAMIYYRRFLDISIELYKETGWIEVLRNVAIGYERIGWIQQNKKDYLNALEQYNLCLIESKKIYDETKTIEALRGVAITYERLGRVKEIQRKYDEAVEYYINNYKLSNEIYNQIGVLSSKRGLANSYHCLGDAYLGQCRFEEALTWFQKDRQLLTEIYTITNMIDDIRDYAISLDRLAITYDNLRMLAEADGLFKESVDIYFRLVEKTNTVKLTEECAIECIRYAVFLNIHNEKTQANFIINRILEISQDVKLNKEINNYLFTLNANSNNIILTNYSSLCNRRNTK